AVVLTAVPQAVVAVTVALAVVAVVAVVSVVVAVVPLVALVALPEAAAEAVAALTVVLAVAALTVAAGERALGQLLQALRPREPGTGDRDGDALEGGDALVAQRPEDRVPDEVGAALADGVPKPAVRIRDLLLELGEVTGHLGLGRGRHST